MILTLAFSLLLLNKVLNYSPLTWGFYCLQIRTSKLSGHNLIRALKGTQHQPGHLPLLALGQAFTFLSFSLTSSQVEESLTLFIGGKLRDPMRS